MKIKLIPETNDEKLRFGNAESIEHSNVKDYFIMGTKLDDDGDGLDFHDWRGQYRFLVGSLQYFYELINDERRSKDSARRVRSEKVNKTPQLKIAEEVIDGDNGDDDDNVVQNELANESPEAQD